MSWLYYFWIIPVLLLLIVVHELGHFLAARLFKVRVLEFAFGFPPRILSVRHGDTVYALNLLPIGGYVRMEGEDGQVVSRYSFPARPGWQRAIILAAGVTMNLLLVPVLLTGVAVTGEPVMRGATVQQIEPGSPAAQAGLHPGTVILAAGRQVLTSERQFVSLIDHHLGQPLTLELASATGSLDQRASVIVVPRVTVQPGQGHLGISFTPHLVTKSFPIWQAPGEGLHQALTLTSSFFGALHAAVATNNLQLSGPVGITKVTGEAAQAGPSILIELTALLSLNLALMNLLPLPALDGGRLAVLLVEGIRRRRLDPQIEGAIHFVGLVVLLMLMVVVSLHEVFTGAQ
ncbi:MAG: M50 family metallopeptidase [Chloroflexi bacterium]|nr:M50 family metallopeptidase [Chloroflexota bacterium]